jgi:hypothetical protein
MSEDDENRARAYRAALAQGQVSRLARARRLAGSGTAIANLRRSWKPIVDWQRERDDRQQ